MYIVIFNTLYGELRERVQTTVRTSKSCFNQDLQDLYNIGPKLFTLFAPNNNNNKKKTNCIPDRRNKETVVQPLYKTSKYFFKFL